MLLKFMVPFICMCVCIYTFFFPFDRKHFHILIVLVNNEFMKNKTLYFRFNRNM